MKPPIDKTTIERRIKLIELYKKRLEELKSLSLNRLSDDDNFAIASYNLRSALEATFDIVTHILSRIPGAQIEEYKKMAIEMGRQKIVPMEFAEKKLEKMARYRNRLTHFYFEVTPKEMYDIIQNDLGDFDVFLKHVKKLLEGI